jgi:hypothetical protein
VPHRKAAEPVVLSVVWMHLIRSSMLDKDEQKGGAMTESSEITTRRTGLEPVVPPTVSFSGEREGGRVRLAGAAG